MLPHEIQRGAFRNARQDASSLNSGDDPFIGAQGWRGRGGGGWRAGRGRGRPAGPSARGSPEGGWTPGRVTPMGAGTPGRASPRGAATPRGGTPPPNGFGGWGRGGGNRGRETNDRGRAGRGRGRGYPRGRGRGAPLKDMHTQNFNYSSQNAQATERDISAYVQDSIRSAVSSGRGSGSLTPRRGYPPRTPQVPVASHHGGLGYHSLASMEEAANTQPSHNGWAGIGRGSGRGFSGMSDALLLKPVAFVKSVGETGLEQGQVPESVEVKLPPAPEIEENRPPSAQALRKALRHQGPPAGFSFPPPPEFATIRDGLPLAANLQSPSSPAPGQHRPLRPEQMFRTAEAVAFAQKVEQNTPQASAGNTDDTVEMTMVTVSETTEAAPEGQGQEPSPTIVDQAALSDAPDADPIATPSFIIDVIGDPSLRSTDGFVSASTITTNSRRPLGVESSSDEEDDLVVWKPSPRASGEPPPSESASLQSFARVIEDPVSATTAVGEDDDESSGGDDPKGKFRRHQVLSPKVSKKAVKAAARRRKAERKRRNRSDKSGPSFRFQYSVLGEKGGMKAAPAIDMDLEGGQAREGDSDLDWGDEGPPKDRIGSGGVVGPPRGSGPASGMSRKQREAGELLADYLEHIQGQDSDDEEGDETVYATRAEADGAALQAFVRGMGAGNQLTLNDLRDIRLMQAEDEEDGEDAEGWQTDTDDQDDGDQSSGARRRLEVDSDGDLILNLTEELNIEDIGVASGSSSSSSSSKDEDDDDDDDAEVATSLSARGLGYSTPREQGKGKQRAAPADLSGSDDEDDDMFEGRFSWDDAPALRRDKSKARSKLYRAIEDGDFTIYDFDDGAVSRKGKGRQLGANAFDDQLQAQWERDRKKKGEYKRARQLARLEAEPTSKKERKKAAKGTAKAGIRQDEDETSLPVINRRIKDFIMEPDKISLPLPPMEKRQRMGVHLLAQAYGLKSKSVGKGDNRFPVLERTTRTTLQVDERKVANILGRKFSGSNKPTPGKGSQNGRSDGLWHEFVGVGTGVSTRNREGAIVGHGAEEIGETNVGYQLLAKMGWSQGAAIGVSGGLATPIAAVVKNSKGGLGLISRR